MLDTLEQSLNDNTFQNADVQHVECLRYWKCYDIGNPVLYSKGYERAISKNLTYTILEHIIELKTSPKL
jgi:hypothetical protein